MNYDEEDHEMLRGLQEASETAYDSDLARVTAALAIERTAHEATALDATTWHSQRDAARAKVSELQKVARAAVAWKAQGARSKWATGPSLALWDALDALPPSMLEKVSDG